MYAYVGSRTTRERNARGRGISMFTLDESQRRLELIDVTEGLVNPSFLTLNTAGSTLYTVHGDRSEVSVLQVDAHTGRLSLIQEQQCGGKNPVHLALDPAGRSLLVSNHLTGTLAVLPVRADGRLQPVSQMVSMPGDPGPHRAEQPFAKPHFNPFDPSGRFVVVPDKGLDRVFCFRFDEGRLQPAVQPYATARETSGPRHLAFHPQRPFVYVVNELDSTVTTYGFDTKTGALDPLQILSTLPDTFTGNSRASEIEVSRDGTTLYASNRGFDSIAVFSVDIDSGRLRFIEAAPAAGKTPRFFALTPNGRTLFALNEDSDTIVGFDVDVERMGQLTPSGFWVHCGSPVCMVFSKPA